MVTLRNNVTLIGNIGMNAHITTFENGQKVARFSLATNRNIKNDSGEYEKKTQWHQLFAFGNLAKFLEKYGEKGKQLAVHGRLVNRTYLNKVGKSRNVTEIEVRHIIGM